jgi:hypothetical protein
VPQPKSGEHELLHPKKAVVGDGDVVVVVESSSSSSSSSQRRRSFFQNHHDDERDCNNSQVVFFILAVVARDTRVVRRAEQNERRVRSIDGIGVLSSEDVR